MGIVAFAVVEELKDDAGWPVWQLGVEMQASATRDVAWGRAPAVPVVWLEGRGDASTSI